MAETETLLGAVLQMVRRRLAEAGIADASLDARLLVTELADVEPADLVARPAQIVGARALAKIDAAVTRRIAGEPVHRVLGHRAFYGLDLALSAATLEPRPDTETLVDLALPHLRDVAAAKGRCRVLDLGTGTGAVALAVLAHVPEAVAVASDLSEAALATARENASALGLSDRFETVRSDWFAQIAGRFDAILSNPPYIRSAEIAYLDVGIRHFDPQAALDGGPTGLDAYAAIAAGASEHLEGRGFVALEIGYDQSADVAGLFEARGFRLLEARKDLGGLERALLFRPWSAERADPPQENTWHSA